MLSHLFHPYDNLILTVRKTRHRSVQQSAEGSRVGGGAGKAGQAGHLESAVPKHSSGMSLWRPGAHGGRDTVFDLTRVGLMAPGVWFLFAFWIAQV